MTAIDSPLAQAIGLAVLHLLWQGTLIALVLAVALRLLARSSANVRYALSCAALAAFIGFGFATAYQSYEPVAPQLHLDDTVTARLGPSGEVVVEEQQTMTAIIVGAIQRHSSTIALLWLAGVVVLATKLTVMWTRARGLASIGTTPAPSEHQQTLRRLSDALGVGRAVRLLESVAVEVPSVVGFLKPVILVPATSLSGLSARQLELILAHELAHIRRHDFLVNMLQSVAETLVFYHPAAWWVSNQIRIERENCCDDLAVATCGNALEYARALTTLEELRTSSRLAIAANGGSLLSRVRRLVTHGDGNSVNGWTAVAAAVTFALVLTITSLPARADRDTDPPPPPEPPAAEMEVLAPEPPEPPEPEEAESPELDNLEPLEAEVEVPATPRAPRAPRAISIAPTPMVAPRPVVVPRVAFAADMADAMADFAEDFADGDDDETPAPAGKLSINDLISLRIHNVTPQYINEMRGVFGNTLTIREITSLKVMDVTPKYIADMRAAGVAIKTAREATSLKSLNVTPDWVRQLAATGYTNLSVRDLTRLAAAGVNADFVREMQKYRSNQ